MIQNYKSLPDRIDTVKTKHGIVKAYFRQSAYTDGKYPYIVSDIFPYVYEWNGNKYKSEMELRQAIIDSRSG